MLEFPLAASFAMSENAIVCDPNILSGIPCFAGTRVPVRILFEYLETGESLELFIDDFP